MSRDIPFNPELTWSISAEEMSLFQKCFRDLKKKVAAALWLFNLQKNFSKYVLKIKLKAMNF